ncbi:MAG: hypothetical protein JXB19_07250 [Bacteroidales bacterium]|nr:hypothetical protein [Bacteroidales bacterium]
MKTLKWFVCLAVLTTGCEEDPFLVKHDFKVKTQYRYHDSSEDEPYGFTLYTYDHEWRLTKELISDYPGPAFASNTYEYSNNGRLLHKKRWAMQGTNFPGQDESDFTLIWECKYSYMGNKQIEKEYHDNELTDSSVYVHSGDLLLEEHHYDFRRSSNWSVFYEYDTQKNLIKKITVPDGNYTAYYYSGSNLVKTMKFNSSDSLLAESIAVYSGSGGTEIVETHRVRPDGNALTHKRTYYTGLLVEDIQYHPAFPGAEWSCLRYDYYCVLDP